MAKPYEIHGIPENAWLEFDEPPDYAVIYETKEGHGTFDEPYGLISGEVRLWGQADYWTALEAALLLVGISPDDYQLYAVEKAPGADEDFVGNGEFYYCWKYAYKFDSARDYLFLFERSNLAPKAPPIEWVKYFNRKVRDISVLPPFEPNYCDKWLEYFSTVLEISQLEYSAIEKPSQEQRQENQKENPLENISRREQQYKIILALIDALEYDPMKIPDGGKAKIKAICMTRGLNTDSGFDHAWKAGVTGGLFRLANHDKFSPK